MSDFLKLNFTMKSRLYKLLDQVKIRMSCLILNIEEGISILGEAMERVLKL